MAFKLIPELDVADLDRSIAFYVGTIGFRVLYDRPEECFAFLALDGVELMLEEAAGPGRRFRTAPLEHPFGRGINFQIEVTDAAALFERVAKVAPIIVPIEDRWYRRDAIELGNRQFVTADPDGYLLRFCSDLGTRRTEDPSKGHESARRLASLGGSEPYLKAPGRRRSAPG